MQFPTTTAVFLSALLSTIAAAPAPQTTVTPGAPTTWEVTNFNLGCSPAGCTYSFTISGPATVDVGSAFTTQCTGTDLQDKFVACADPKVTSNLVPETTGLILSVIREGPAAAGGPVGIMSGNATAAASGEPALENFSIPAYFYGDIAS
ncbi:uncharacterized protein LY89DRAFT_107032 [Mollisia scopiformis]|uniref:Uncharacterized protein n=1 Tax=Mollisia scopiformis TaxID=149040 RepID=A0A194X595_MOLSC|nr:uncharacterized protein LY89DRAFT_107032 [Mollisia scopiformis]KUJ15239.1 hypothetical protein LY89DRAFT_107032 [Mollisia scopiformis]